MRATRLFDAIGQDKLFATVDQAIAAIYDSWAKMRRTIFSARYHRGGRFS